MAIFDRFRRNRQQSVLPDEVKQYYQAETRQRRGMALILAIGALIATVAVAAGLFFGGRFIYNKIQGDDKKTAQPASQIKDENGNKDFGQVNNDNNQAQTPSSTPAAGSGSAPATSTPSNPEPQTPSPTTPALGDTPAPLPHTGDEGL